MTSSISQGLYEARMGTRKLQLFVSWSSLVPVFSIHSCEYTGISCSARHLQGPHPASAPSVYTT